MVPNKYAHRCLEPLLFYVLQVKICCLVTTICGFFIYLGTTFISATILVVYRGFRPPIMRKIQKTFVILLNSLKWTIIIIYNEIIQKGIVYTFNNYGKNRNEYKFIMH